METVTFVGGSVFGIVRNILELRELRTLGIGGYVALVDRMADEQMNLLREVYEMSENDIDALFMDSDEIGKIRGGKFYSAE